MPAPDSFERKRIDPRIYLGILVFRWKLIVVCFLYCLLGGVAYIELAPKQYLTTAAIAVHRDPATYIDTTKYQWAGAHTHIGLLKSPQLNARVVEKLAPKWAPRLGSPAELWPPLQVVDMGAGGIALWLKIQNTHPGYARAYLRELIEQFRVQREIVKDVSYNAAVRVLEDELARLKEQIREAEEQVIEFQRVNQMEFVQIKGTLELGYLNELLARHQQLSTERWMLEVQFPRLKGGSPEMIHDAYLLTRETGNRRAPVPTVGAAGEDVNPTGTPAAGGPVMASGTKATGTPPEGETPAAEEKFDEGRGYQDLRVRIAHLERQRKELLVSAQPDNPKIRAIDEEIAGLRSRLELMSEVEFARMKERAAAIDLQMEALEEAQRRWKNSYLMASRKGADFRHLQLVVGRLESMYNSLYNRLNDLKIDREIKAEFFAVSQPVHTEPKPVWPDPWKILFASLAAGLGSGLGLALLAFFIDDKVQSVNDVEVEVGVPFLGGIPFWVHTDLATRIRPIVSEQHRSGAAEAYRALRTNVLSAVDKAGKKVLLITSADSKEGKTLTALNLAIMIAKTGKRVLLADMDLRRGVLHKSLEVERQPGITDALRDGRPLREITVATPHENLWFAPAGSLVKNTSELLHAVDLQAVLGEVAEQYDYVIMDSAPVLRVTDTVIVAGVPLCGVIYVAHANHTPKPIIKYSLDMLGDVHVIGLIVNSIEMHRISSLYYTYQYPNYAYYSYAYAYGYDYDLYEERTRAGGRRPPPRLSGMRHRFARWFRRTFMPAE